MSSSATAAHRHPRLTTASSHALAAAFCAFIIGCGPQVAAHEVELWSDCSGTDLQGSYAFDDHDFETTGCSGGGLLTSTCEVPLAEGRWLSGDQVVDRIYLSGTEHSELYQYELLITPQPGQLLDSPGQGQSHIWCGVYRDDETDEHSNLGEKVDCYFSNIQCQARVVLLDE